jgi:uncharacterized protein
MTDRTRITVPISENIGAVSGLVMKPTNVAAVLVLAHGAGAGMEHSFMESLATALADHSIATVRFNFPYTENKKGRPDPAAVAEKTVAMVTQHARDLFSDIPLFAGGKSFGGRMTSQRLSKESPSYVKGIVFFGFPLHPVGAPSVERAAHLQNIYLPMLFLQGTRDKLAEMALLTKTCSSLPTATLRILDGADHSFQQGKKNFIPELAEYASAWMKNL